jgi:hypothetical protein
MDIDQGFAQQACQKQARASPKKPTRVQLSLHTRLSFGLLLLSHVFAVRLISPQSVEPFPRTTEKAPTSVECSKLHHTYTVSRHLTASAK